MDVIVDIAGCSNMSASLSHSRCQSCGALFTRFHICRETFEELKAIRDFVRMNRDDIEDLKEQMQERDKLIGYLQTQLQAKKALGK